jgi:hypothetical protein
MKRQRNGENPVRATIQSEKESKSELSNSDFFLLALILFISKYLRFKEYLLNHMSEDFCSG